MDKKTQFRIKSLSFCSLGANHHSHWGDGDSQFKYIAQIISNSTLRKSLKLIDLYSSNISENTIKTQFKMHKLKGIVVK